MSSDKPKKGFRTSLKLNDRSNIMIDENLEKQINEKIQYIKKMTLKESIEEKKNLRSKKNKILNSSNESFEFFDEFVNAENEINLNKQIENEPNDSEYTFTETKSKLLYGKSGTINYDNLNNNGQYSSNYLNYENKSNSAKKKDLNSTKENLTINNVNDYRNINNNKENQLNAYKRNESKLEWENCFKKIQKRLLKNFTSNSCKDPKFTYFNPDCKEKFYSNNKAEKNKNIFFPVEVRKKHKSNNHFSHPFKNLNNLKLKSNVNNRINIKNDNNQKVKKLEFDVHQINSRNFANSKINSDESRKNASKKKIIKIENLYLDSHSEKNNLINESDRSKISLHSKNYLSRKKFTNSANLNNIDSTNYNHVSTNDNQSNRLFNDKRLSNTVVSIPRSSTLEKNNNNKNFKKFSSTQNILESLDAEFLRINKNYKKANNNLNFSNKKLNNENFKHERSVSLASLENENKRVDLHSNLKLINNKNQNDHNKQIDNKDNKKQISTKILSKNLGDSAPTNYICLQKNLTQTEFESDLFDIQSKRKTILIDRRITFRRMKVYDSLSDDEFELEAHEFILRPNSFALVLLDFLILLSLAYSTFMVPMRLIFHNHTNLFFIGIEVCIDFCLLMDFVLTFFTGFYDFEENYNRRFSSILLNYTRNYLIIDLLTLVPFGSLLELNQYFSADNVNMFPNFDDLISDLFVLNNYSFERLLKIFRLIKLIKVFSDNKFVCFLKNFFFPEFTFPFQVKASLYYFYFLILTHILSCSFIFLGTVSRPNWIINAGLTNSSFADIYLASIYFNHLTILTIGYGDIISKNSFERIYNVMLMIFGVMLYSFVLSWISNLVVQNNEKSKKFDSKKDYLNQLCLKYNITNSLYTKISVHLRHEMQFFKSDRNQLLNELPNSLKNEVVLEMYRRNINSINFLKYCQNTDFVIQVVLALRPTKCYKDQIILKEGDLIEEMLILKNGILSIEKGINFILPFSAANAKGDFLIPNQEILTLKILNLRKNDHFGDSLMIQNLRSPISLRVKSKYAELLLMAKLELIKLSNKYPEIYNKIFKISEFNIKQIQRTLENAEKLIKKNSKEHDSFANGGATKSKASANDKEFKKSRRSIKITNLADYHLRDEFVAKTGEFGSKQKIEAIEEEDEDRELEEELDSQSGVAKKVYDDLDFENKVISKNKKNRKFKGNREGQTSFRKAKAEDARKIKFKCGFDFNTEDENMKNEEHDAAAANNSEDFDDPVHLLGKHKLNSKNSNNNFDFKEHKIFPYNFNNNKKKDEQMINRQRRSNLKNKDHNHINNKKKEVENEIENRAGNISLTSKELIIIEEKVLDISDASDKSIKFISKKKSNNNASLKDKKLFTLNEKFANKSSEGFKNLRSGLKNIENEVSDFELDSNEYNLVPNLIRNSSSIKEEIFTDEIIDISNKPVIQIIPEFLSSNKENLDKFVPDLNFTKKTKNENDKIPNYNIKAESLNISINKNVNNFFYTPDFDLRTLNDFKLTSEEIKMLLLNRRKSSLNNRNDNITIDQEKNKNIKNLMSSKEANFDNKIMPNKNSKIVMGNDFLNKYAFNPFNIDSSNDKNFKTDKNANIFICDKCLHASEQLLVNNLQSEKQKQQKFEFEIVKSNKINKPDLLVQRTNQLELGTKTSNISNFNYKEDCISEFKKIKEYLRKQKLSIKNFIDFLSAKEENDIETKTKTKTTKSTSNVKYITFKKHSSFNHSKNKEKKTFKKEESLNSNHHKKKYFATYLELNSDSPLKENNSLSFNDAEKQNAENPRRNSIYKSKFERNRMFSKQESKRHFKELDLLSSPDSKDKIKTKSKKREIIKDEVNNILKSTKNVLNPESDKDLNNKFFQELLENQDINFKKLIKKEESQYLKLANASEKCKYSRRKSSSLGELGFNSSVISQGKIIRKKPKSEFDSEINVTKSVSVNFNKKQSAIERNGSYKDFLRKFEFEKKIDAEDAMESERFTCKRKQSNKAFFSKSFYKNNKNSNKNCCSSVKDFAAATKKNKNVEEKNEESKKTKVKVDNKSQSLIKFFSQKKKENNFKTKSFNSKKIFISEKEIKNDNDNSIIYSESCDDSSYDFKFFDADIKMKFNYHENLINRLDYLFKNLEIKSGIKSRKEK